MDAVPQLVCRIWDSHNTGWKSLILDLLVRSREMLSRVDGLAENILVPLPLVPGTFVYIRAGADFQRFGHDARWHRVVRPDASVCETSSDGEIFGPVEGLRRQANHATQEALQVVLDVFNTMENSTLQTADVRSEKDLLVLVFGHRAEEKLRFDCLHGILVHVAVLVCLRAKQDVFLGQVLVR